MPPIGNNTDEDIEELGSSTNSNPDAATEGQAAEGGEGEGAAAQSSSANTDDNDASLLSVVKDVVSERPAAAASSAEGGTDGQATGDSATQAGPDNENFSDVPFHKHPRFQEVIRQRNGFREDAGRYKNITDYLDANGLNAEEAANALHTFARAKVDPAGAFAELKPWLQQLLVAAGEVLPDDLRGRVEKGEMSAETALELSRERARVKSHETRQSFDQQRAQRQSQVSLANELATTAQTWEQDRQAKDPNWAAKQPLIMREIAYLQTTEGKPTNKDGVLAQLKKAYDAVNKTFVAPAAQQSGAPPAGRKPAIKPVNGGSVNGSVREKPRTTLDIVRARGKASAG
ncbi:hypothetical protein [Bradyrhizobium sp. 33ap4]|uniref:hypothetical protein n=1 Tax=Bradyrhizobium sp. 33ap4 TaxID=3061630 RepID=UPI00292DC9B2|nr:hypothetical protein [Bradyrhizobium sp. 33ap4]